MWGDQLEELDSLMQYIFLGLFGRVSWFMRMNSPIELSREKWKGDWPVKAKTNSVEGP